MTMKAFTIDSLISDPSCCIGADGTSFLTMPSLSTTTGHGDSANRTDGWRHNDDVTVSPPGGEAEIKSMEGR